MQISEAWSLVCELIIASGATNIAREEGCWEYCMPPWHIAFNPHGKYKYCSRRVIVPSYTVYVEYDQIPAAYIAPLYGAMIKEVKIDEDNFIAALRHHIDYLKYPPCEVNFIAPSQQAV
jgi:hypothetical protein